MAKRYRVLIRETKITEATMTIMVPDSATEAEAQDVAEALLAKMSPPDLKWTPLTTAETQVRVYELT